MNKSGRAERERERERERQTETERDRERERENHSINQSTSFYEGSGEDSRSLYIQPLPMRETTIS